MDEFDDAFEAPPPNVIPGDRMGFMEHQIQYLYSEVTYLRGMTNQAPTPQPRPNLNLSPPSNFFGTPSDLPMFKLRLYQYLMGNFNTYGDNATQFLYAGSLLEGSAAQWYSTLVDPITLLLPPSYKLDSFWQELEDFFGGGVTLQSRERSLDVLRQTGSVSELAISFQNITSPFTPRWSDHPLIYVFSTKLKEVVRFELMSRGTIPVTFQAYVALAIKVELNQAAAASSRS